MPPKKVVPAKKKLPVPVDYSGMDPEMAKTMKGESARVVKQKAIFAPLSLFKKKPLGQADQVKRKGKR